MTDSILSELLVLFLMTLSCCRVFFLKRPRIDVLASLPAFAFTISILNLFIWGISVVEIILLLISFILFLMNLPALLLLLAELFVDYYHPVFIIANTLILIATLVTATFAVIFRPVASKTSGITVTRDRYIGKFSTGFIPSLSNMEKANAVIWKFEPLEPQNDNVTYKTMNGQVIKGKFENKKPFIIFIGDKRANVEQYRPYLEHLAHDGYTVLAADFYTSDMKWITILPDTALTRRFVICIQDLLNIWDLEAQKNAYSARIIREYTSLMEIAKKYNPEQNPYYLVGDEMCKEALTLASSVQNENVTGTFCLSDIDLYSAGYGCIEQTDPLLAYLHNRKRENTLFLPAVLASRTEDSIIACSNIIVEKNNADEKKKLTVTENIEYDIK